MNDRYESSYRVDSQPIFITKLQIFETTRQTFISLIEPGMRKTLINVLNFISSVTEISFPSFLVIEIIHSHTDCLQPSCLPNVITNGRETGVFLFLSFCIKNVAGLPFTLFCPFSWAGPVRRAK